MHVCVLACLRVCVCACEREHVHVHVHVHVQSCICVCVIVMCVYMYIAVHCVCTGWVGTGVRRAASVEVGVSEKPFQCHVTFSQNVVFVRLHLFLEIKLCL